LENRGEKKDFYLVERRRKVIEGEGFIQSDKKSGNK